MDEQTGASSSGAIDDAKKRPAAPTKVGIVFRTLRKGFFDFKIYVVDVDNSNREYSEMKPVVRFKIPRVSLDVLTCCILNSTVYIFRGYNSNIRPGSGALPEKKKSAYKLVLSPQDLASAEEQKVEQLSSIHESCHAKGFPVALPTPDGKQIVVFSRCFLFKESYEAFEVLNVDDDSWATLPRLPCRNCSFSDSSRSWCNCASEDLVHVNAFSFIGNAVFYIEMDIGAFGLDLRKNEWTWVDNLLGAPAADWSIYLGYLETVKGRYAIMPGPTPVYEDDGTPVPGSHPTLRVYDFGDEGFFGPKRGADDAPRPPADVIRLSRFDPPQDSLWLEALDPVLFPLRPEDEETACCFVVRQLEGWQTDEEDSEEEMQQVEGAVESEEDFVDMEDLGLAVEPEPDEDYYTMQKLEALKPEPDEDYEENFEELYDPRGETRILIQVCRTDLKSRPLKFNVSNAVSVRIRFHIKPYDVSLFTL